MFTYDRQLISKGQTFFDLLPQSCGKESKCNVNKTHPVSCLCQLSEKKYFTYSSFLHITTGRNSEVMDATSKHIICIFDVYLLCLFAAQKRQNHSGGA